MGVENKAVRLGQMLLRFLTIFPFRQDTKEAQLYAAQAHLKLGEVSVESENYLQAVEEFQACLNLQEQYLEAHDRLLAETHYQLGLAYGYNSQYDEAVAQFSKSIEVIEKRMGKYASSVSTIVMMDPVSTGFFFKGSLCVIYYLLITSAFSF